MRNWHGDGIWYGADYNPEQWPEQTWAEDVELMRRAGVNLVSVGIFSWALLEPAPGRYVFDWLDRAIDLLHDGGISVDLATATASPPPWLAHRHPETLPRRADGTVLWPGGRQAYCPSSPVFRDHSLALVEAVARRYARHPAVVLWHVSNELGCHNVHCYCDVSAEAFRGWLRERYGDLDSLNAAWAPPSGASATTTGPRSTRRVPRRRSPTRRSSWTSCGSPPTSSAPSCAPSGNC